jgi:gp16 family phage-associated protein
MSLQLRTPQEVLGEFRARGETVTAWARQHGFQRQSVYGVLTGRIKGFRGEAHRVAVALGIKASPEDSHAGDLLVPAAPFTNGAGEHFLEVSSQSLPNPHARRAPP